jgi:hypothetical protein
LTLGFFINQTNLGPLTNGLKPFPIWLHIRRDIRKAMNLRGVNDTAEITTTKSKYNSAQVTSHLRGDLTQNYEPITSFKVKIQQKYFIGTRNYALSQLKAKKLGVH